MRGVGPAVPTSHCQADLTDEDYQCHRGNPEFVRRSSVFADMYNLNITPVVPMLGSLGASGDLAPLAHLCLPMIGEGEVVYKREQMPAAKAIMLAGLDTLQLEAKEGLALINGTQYSLAWLVYTISSANRLAEVCDMCAAMSMDAFDAHPALMDAGIHAVRKQLGQIQTALN